MIYLDNSATTRTMGVAAEAAKKYMTEEFFNPAAAYSPAVREERAVNGARRTIGSAINAGPDEIIFTSGGTESNNMAILGSLKAMRGRGRIIVGSTEHPSVYEVYKSLACQYDVVEAPVDNTGTIDLKRLESLITPDTRLVSVMQVNNEVGAVNDAEAIRRMLRRRAPETLLHVDGVQGFLKVPFKAKTLGADLISVSGHKIHGPKGVGALYIKQGTRIDNLIHGGAQERGRRASTENVAGIVGMAEAIELATANIPEKAARISALRDQLIDGLTALPYVRLNGHRTKRLPGNVNVSVRFIEGESLLLRLDLAGVAASSGSACTSGSLDPSHVLLAIGLPHEIAHGSLRLSLSDTTTQEEVDYVLSVLPGIIEYLRDMSPLYNDFMEAQK